MERDYFIVYSDGACSGNPGPGGWGAILLSPSNEVIEMGSADYSTTNNRMEMTASIEALHQIPEGADIHFYTDSTYVIRGITQWVWGWKKRGWKTAEGGPVSNQDLWEKMLRVTNKKNIEWKYSRGHIGIPGNERCDRIAVAFSKNDHVSLYRGSLNNYNVDLFQFPKDTNLPDMKSKASAGEKKKPVSYLSNLGGIVFRHTDWPSCQRRVAGQSGAKFKKAHSEAEEKEILQSWGLPTTHKIT